MSVSDEPVVADDAVTQERERARLEAVRRTALLDSPAEEAFDRLTKIAAELIEAPVTFISIVDEHRDFYKSCYGFDANLSRDRELSGTTFCHYAIASDVPLVINDTKAHPVYSQVPTVQSLGVAAYVGIPLKLSTGEVIGSFCAVDSKPRVWSERDVRVISELALSALREIELRLALRTAEERTAEAETARRLAARHEADVLGKHDLILASTADGIFGLDSAGRVTFVNRAATAMLGWKAEDLLGREQHSIVHKRADGSPYPLEECPIYQVLNDGQTRSGDREVFFHQNGSFVPIEFTSAAMVENGAVTGAVVTFRDITERQIAEARANELIEVQTARAAAEAAAEAREEFLAVISHELRTPMTSIRGWVKVLREDDSDEETRRMAFDAIDASSRAQAQLIDDLLDVTRIARGKLKIERQSLDVHTVITAAVNLLRPDAAARGITIRAELLPTGVTVHADPQRMQQVLMNILSNAMKFTPRGGLVRVDVQPEQDHVVIRVADTGVGIEREMLPAIFTPYRQAESAAFGGLGLGLAIVRHLVEAHGGSVWAESEGKGKGATFLIRLPIHRG